MYKALHIIITVLLFSILAADIKAGTDLLPSVKIYSVSITQVTPSYTQAEKAGEDFGIEGNYYIIYNSLAPKILRIKGQKIFILPKVQKYPVALSNPDQYSTLSFFTNTETPRFISFKNLLI